MRTAKALALAVLALGACHHSKHSSKADMTVVPHSVPVVIDGFQNSFNVPFISITVCAPGSTTACATIDHVIVDTGSVGLRIPKATLTANPAIATALVQTQVGGQPLSECYIYAAGYFYGSVSAADVQIAGERATSMPVQIGGDLASVPTACSGAVQGAQEIDTPSRLGGNAIIGVMGNAEDCGNDCTGTSKQGNPTYYTCAGSGCDLVGVPLEQQVPNPIAVFGQDDNGYIITLPSVDDATGAVNPTGTMTFGLGTQDDNDIDPKSNIYMLDNSNSLTAFTSTIGSASFPITILDSGTAYYLLTLPSVAACTDQQLQGFYCPTSLQTLTMNITDSMNKTGTSTVKIADANSLFTTSTNATTAFSDLGLDSSAVNLPSKLFIAGLPHFYGRTLYFGIDGKVAGDHTGPFYGITN